MKKIDTRFIFLIVLLLCVQFVLADGFERKMSTCIRQIVASQQKNHREQMNERKSSVVSAFIKTTTADSTLLTDEGCRILTRIGDIFIAEVPVCSLHSLAQKEEVLRIETQYGSHLFLDTTAVHVNAIPAYEGENLPQAFTGKGVVLGISDIGFDLTHPTFYNSDGTKYRITRFLDQFTSRAEDYGHVVPLGVEYVTKDEILQKKHSDDATSQIHGTHCLGIAAGSGFDTDFRGMAYEASLCVVSSKTGDEVNYSPNEVAILKYIFDYADSVGMPCVITYSVGFDYIPGDAILYEEALQQLLGPGHILVAAAGNENGSQKYFHKKRGVERAGGATSGGWFSPGITFRVITNDVCRITFEEIDTHQSIFVDTDNVPDGKLQLGSRSVYVSQTDSIFTFEMPTDIWESPAGYYGIIVEGIDAEAHVLADFYTSFFNMSSDNRFIDVEEGHNVILPGTISDVVTVGAINYRTSYKNSDGSTEYDFGGGKYGEIAPFSSVGPTIYGHIKPDVVAPGVNIISALNSYFGGNSGKTVATSHFNNRDYKWIAESGTSMATPAAAGVIALWLQAKPDLTPKDVLDVIAHTSQKPKFSGAENMSFPNNIYGHGVIDAYRGLLHILDTNAITGLSDHQPALATFHLEGRQLTALFTSPQRNVNLSVYTTSGMKVASVHDNTIDLSSLPKGLYIVQLNTGDPSTTGSTIIRL